MHFNLTIPIRRTPEEVFAFLRDKHAFPQQRGSPVLVLEKITPGAVGIGTRFREVVRMLPLVRGEIFSRVTRFEPYRCLQEEFWGAGMSGWLTYTFNPHEDGTLLVQDQIIEVDGLLKLLMPLMRAMLARRLRGRLIEIHNLLEGGWPVTV